VRAVKSEPAVKGVVAVRIGWPKFRIYFFQNYMQHFRSRGIRSGLKQGKS
jgi:hypothetical protein